MHVCPVCGYPHLTEAPRSASGGGSYEICPSCGFQFGVDDDDRGLTFASARERWLTSGMAWWSRSRPSPRDWDPKAQIDGLTASPPSSRRRSSAKHSARKRRPDS